MDTNTTTTHPTAAEAEQHELRELTRGVEDYRAAGRIPFNALRGRFPSLPSDKPYKKILAGDFTEMNVGDMLARVRGVWQTLEAEREQRARADLYPDMRPAEQVSLAVSELLRETGDNRFVFVAGRAAHGKTCALRLLADRYAGVAVLVTAHEGWSSYELAMSEVAAALGVEKGADGRKPRGGGAWLAAIAAGCRASRALLLIDEAHHMTGKLLNAVKHLINTTGLRIVAAGIPTLWEKLTSQAYEEAQQLRLNRMFCRVELGPPPADDAARFLARRVGRPVGKGAAARVAEAAREFGAYKFLHRVGEALIEAGGEGEVGDSEASAAALKITRDITGRS